MGQNDQQWLAKFPFWLILFIFYFYKYSDCDDFAHKTPCRSYQISQRQKSFTTSFPE
jgi:hypothetical protein